VIRRFVLGLAIAALVAPTAQARVDELGAGTQGSASADQPWAVIQGDDKVISPKDGGAALVIHGDDKVISPTGGGSALVIHGDDKVISPTGGGSATLIHGDDKVIAPQPGTHSLAGYRRALPDDYGNRVVAPVDTVSSPNAFDWSDAFAGAGVAFALMLLASAAVFGTRRARPTAA
jgi:hypothetical protein